VPKNDEVAVPALQGVGEGMTERWVFWCCFKNQWQRWRDTLWNNVQQLGSSNWTSWVSLSQSIMV